MASIIRKRLAVQTEAVGLYVATYSPGDGVTRYRFFTRQVDYFESDSLYTALGRKEAFTFLAGVGTGRQLSALGYVA